MRKDLVESNCPICLWDYCLERRGRINNLTAKDIFNLKEETPYTTVFGREGDISALSDFSWYEAVYYLDHKQPFPFAKDMLGCYLGPSTGVGNEYCSWILRSNGRVISRRTVRPLTHIESTSSTERKKLQYFDECIKSKFGDGITGPKEFISEQAQNNLDFDDYEDDEKFSKGIEPSQVAYDTEGQPINQQPVHDQLINKSVRLSHNDERTRAKVIGRTVGDTGTTCGTYNANPYHNTVVYDVEFPDGKIKEYAASIIAERMIDQVDKESMELNLFDNILDHRRTWEAISADDGRRDGHDQRESTKSTRGWCIKVLWKDGNEEWIPLEEVMVSHPPALAEYARAQ